jgi:quinolinate synthase
MKRDPAELQKEILALKEQTGATILAHNYVDGAIQDIADFCGDSLELSVKAKKYQADLIVFCGVRFMAETAKILSPDSRVILPNSTAGCPMADMAQVDEVRKYRKEHPDEILVAYVNSTAAVKAQVDWCCTSGNVERVLNAIPADAKIMFLPDRNLGANMTDKLGRPMSLWSGCCPVHDRITLESIREARAAHPDAEVLVHPECRPMIVEAADAALSTGGMLRHVSESLFKEFIIGTELGIIHRMQRENPDKVFHPLLPQVVCADMKKITLENVLAALQGKCEEIVLDPEIMTAARKPIERMLAL